MEAVAGSADVAVVAAAVDAAGLVTFYYVCYVFMLLLSSYLLSLSHRFMQFVLWLPCLGFACSLTLSHTEAQALSVPPSFSLLLFLFAAVWHHSMSA